MSSVLCFRLTYLSSRDDGVPPSVPSRKMKTPCPQLWAACAAALFTSPFTVAQTPAAAARTAEAPKEEAIQMSAFEVSSDSNRGYVASETLTGTRVVTQIKDLPYTVNVLTSEFFEDFGMFQLDDTLTQVGGLTGLDIGGSFNLRGFASTSQLRDGFYRLGRYGQTNVDRIEVIKGPNAGIYGRTSPGGMVNMISKAPKKRELIQLTGRFGDYKTQQGTLEATGSITPSTYYILTLSQFSRGFDMDYARTRENQGYLAVKHDFADGSHLLVSAEYFLQYRHSPSTAAPLIIDQKGTTATTDDEVIGLAKNLARYEPYGPNAELNRGSITYLAAYDRKLNDIFSIRAAVQNFRARRWDYNTNTGFGTINVNQPPNAVTGIVPTPTTTRGALPSKGLIQEDGGGFQGDLVANYALFNGTVKNKTLVTIDFNDYYRWDPTWTTGADAATVAWNAAGSGRVITLNPDYTPTAPLTYFPERFNWNNEILTRLTRRRATVAGGQLRQESHWMNDKLLTYFGARYDSVRFHERDYAATISGVKYTVANPYLAERKVRQTKPNFGALYKVTPNFRVYANYSESYFINQTDNPVDVGSVEYKPETAKGEDFGIKGSFFNERLNYTIGGYYIERFNVSVQDTVETFPGSGSYQNISRRDGDQLDRGVEADINWTLNSHYSTGLSYGHVNAKYTNFGSAFPQAVGRDVQNISPDNGSAYLKYNAGSGLLKGFSANIGVTYVASTPTESPSAGDVPPNAAGVRSTVSNFQWKVRVPSYTLWNLGLHYHLRSSAKIEQTFHLNVNNALDKEYLKGSGGSFSKNLGDARAIYFSYTLAFSRLGQH
jgi:iron complex outermembrane receptor protein